MRVLIVTQEDPFYLPIFFREFFRLRAAERQERRQEERPGRGLEHGGDEIEIVGVMIQRALGNRDGRGLARRMLGLYGPVGFMRIGARDALRKAQNALAGMGLLREGFSIQWFCAQAGVAVLPLTDINAPETVEFVRQEVDLVVSVAASQIFRRPVLEAAPLGCINLHNAPLPHYRGMLPNFWQMYHDEPCSVLTIHQMVEQLDKGDILLQQKTEIEPGMSLDALIKKTKARSAAALLEVLRGLRDGTVTAAPLPDEEGSYFSFPTRQDARAFRARGKRLL